MPSVPTVAFLIASHSRPAQVDRLIARLLGDSPVARVVLHHDPTGAPWPAVRRHDTRLEPVPGAVPVRWGDFSQVEMLVRSCAHALVALEFDWLVTLSGQDYPVRPVGELEAFLAATPYDGFIERSPVAPPGWPGRLTGRTDEFARRYFFHYAPAGSLLARVWPAHLRRRAPDGRLLLGHPTFRVPFSPDFVCHRGADWVTLSRTCVERVVAATWARPDLVAHYRRTWLPVESFPHTILHNDPGLRLSGDYRRYTRWRPGASHPNVLTLDDIDEIRASGCFFARKFDAGLDARVLDALDAG